MAWAMRNKIFLRKSTDTCRHALYAEQAASTASLTCPGPEDSTSCWTLPVLGLTCSRMSPLGCSTHVSATSGLADFSISAAALSCACNLRLKPGESAVVCSVSAILATLHQWLL